MLLTLSWELILKLGPLIFKVNTGGAIGSVVNEMSNAKASAILVTTHNGVLTFILLGKGWYKLIIISYVSGFISILLATTKILFPKFK